MQDMTSDRDQVPVFTQLAARTYTTQVEITVLLEEIARQIELLASGEVPNAEALQNIRRGIGHLRESNDKALGLIASLAAG